MDRESIINELKSAMKSFSESQEEDEFCEGQLDGMKRIISLAGIMTDEEVSELESVIEEDVKEERRMIEELQKRGYTVERA